MSAIAAAALLRSSARAYASAALHELQRTAPEAIAALPTTFAAPFDDLEVRILHLAESIGVDRPALLQQSVAWYKVAFHHRGVPADYLERSLRAIERVLQGELPQDAAARTTRHLEAARPPLARVPVVLPSELSRQAPHGELAMRFLLAILERRGEDAFASLRNALRGGLSVEAIHDHVLTPVQREIGRMWLMGEVPIADEHFGSGIVERVLWLLQEHLPLPPEGAPTVLMLGVGGNLHDLGLRVVAQRLQIAGFAVQMLGANMPASDMEWALADRPVDLVALSVTLALHVRAAAEMVAHVRMAQQKLERPAPILVGGEVFRHVPDLHTRIGADGAAFDAAGAVQAARRLLGVEA